MRQAQEMAANGQQAEAERLLARAYARGGGSELVAALVELLASDGRQAEAASMAVTEANRFLAEGSVAPGLDLLEWSASLLPEQPALHLALGRAHLSGRRFSAAEASLERALELDDQSLEILFAIAGVRWELGRVEAAAEAYHRAVGVSGGSLEALARLGRFQLWRGEHDEAVSTLAWAAARGNASLELQLDLGAALAAAGQGERAREVLTAVAQRAPENRRARYLLARELQKAGAREEAQRELAAYGRLYERDQVATRDAGLEQAALDRGVELLRRGLVEAALSHLEALPETPAVLVALAEALAAVGDSAGAVAALERAVAAAPERSDLRALLAAARQARVDSP